MIMFNSKNKEIERLKSIIEEQGMIINNFRLLNRDLSIGPHEFIVSSAQAKFKDFKVIHKGEDISKKVVKIILYGPEFI